MIVISNEQHLSTAKFILFVKCECVYVWMQFTCKIQDVLFTACNSFTMENLKMAIMLVAAGNNSNKIKCPTLFLRRDTAIVFASCFIL